MMSHTSMSWYLKTLRFTKEALEAKAFTTEAFFLDYSYVLRHKNYALLVITTII
jgi:hypothetical protein